MSSYVKATNFTAKDALASGNAAKIIRGSEFDTEFNAIATAVATKADTASPVLTGTPTAPTAAVWTNTTQLATTAFVMSQLGTDFQATVGASGSALINGEWIIKWGPGVAGQVSAGAYLNNFPTPFPNGCFVVIPVHLGADPTVNIVLDGFTKTGFSLRSNFPGSGSVGALYIAFGN